MKHCPEVSQPSSLSYTHTKVPLSGVLRWLPARRYLTASPDHVCNGHSTHTHTPRCWNRDWRRKRSSAASHRSLSWCRLTRSKQSAVFLRRYVKHQGRSVRPYLLPVWRLHGNPLWRHHLVGVSRSQHERYIGEREEGKGRPGRKAHCILLLCCIASGNCCPFFTNIDYFVEKQHAVLFPMLDCPKHWPLHLIQTIVDLNLTLNHSGLERQINAYLFSTFRNRARVW